MTSPTEVSNDVREAMDKAKIGLMSKANITFFVTVCLSLRHQWDNTIPTANCNGITVKYNPKFFAGLNHEERMFLMLHETLHAAYLHMLRLSEYDPKKWNYACDFVINLQLVKMGFKMPADGLLDHAFDGMSAEQVYQKLPDPPESYTMDISSPSAGSADGDEDDDSGSGGSGLQGPGMAPEQLRAHIDEVLVRAQIQAQQAGDNPGNIPGDLRIYLERLLNPQLPWYQLLRRFMNKLVKNDYSFRSPNRRYFPEHILPSQHSETLADFAIAVDTSGSVTKHQFLHFVTETAGIIKSHRPKNLSFIQFDTEIKSIDMVESLHDLKKVEFMGRGGTNITEVIKWANVNKPQVLVMFTDGMFHIPEVEPIMPVLWVIHGNPNFTAPYGKVIHYKFTN